MSQFTCTVVLLLLSWQPSCSRVKSAQFFNLGLSYSPNKLGALYMQALAKIYDILHHISVSFSDPNLAHIFLSNPATAGVCQVLYISFAIIWNFFTYIFYRPWVHKRRSWITIESGVFKKHGWTHGHLQVYTRKIQVHINLVTTLVLTQVKTTNRSQPKIGLSCSKLTFVQPTS